ncbi:shikimate kinase [Candidatus Poribacteria bacterium]|nr:shikimate kinase [Candidatus Poribacteria bacterium]
MQQPVKRKPNIVLVGFMGTGKTSIGRRLSSQLRMRYVDTDDVVERNSGRRISAIFAEDGESAFRELESEAVREVSKLYNHVISTGGGVVLKEANMIELKRNGIVFCLTASAKEIYRRVGHQTHRPLLQTPDPLAKIQSMLAERQPYYVKADHVISTTGRSFGEIITHIKRVFTKSIRNSK